MVTIRNELLSALTSDEQAIVRPHLKYSDLPHGTTLHRVGEPVQRVLFPDRGAISLVVGMATGEFIETGLVGSDGVIGGAAALHGHPILNTAVVQIDAAVLSLEVGAFLELCRKAPRLTTLVVSYNRFLHAQAQQVAACNVMHSLDARFGRWLLRANDLCGPRLPLTQEALAALLGVRRTSVSITAHGLQEQEIIRYRRGVIEITDLDALRRISCECHDALQAQKRRLGKLNARSLDQAANRRPVV